MDGEIFIEFIGEVVFRIFFLILKGIWVSILWLFNLGRIPYMTIWEKPMIAWRGGLALMFAAIGFMVFVFI
ncbi:MAG: hypothetical protein O9353_04505 [Bacteroidia bacterium]|nr:hypothetical protein [Bacteroidia bacterium]